MQIKEIHLVLHVLVTWFIRESVGKHLLVAYWGQNGAWKKFPNSPEKELKEVCQKRKYDIVVIGFVVTFSSRNNKDEMPEVNFSAHCWDPVSPEYPNLYKCPKIEAGIKACQEAGKKVLISLGGATGNNDLTDAEAKVFAKNLWDLFLGGTGKKNIRPFGSAILDGIDLDIEDDKPGGYAQLVTSLRQLETSAGTKKYLITAAPQCPFPDASLGPKAGTALGDKGGEFDYVFVQFYNNFCHTGDPAQFYPNMDRWLQFAGRKRSMGKGPKIFIGLPAATGGAGDPKYYRKPKEIGTIYEKLKNKQDFGGFMLWDAAWDQQNVINGKVYSDHIADIIGRNGTAATTVSPAGNTTTPGGNVTTPTGLPTPTTLGLTTPGRPTSPVSPEGNVTTSAGNLTTPGASPTPTTPGPTTPTRPTSPVSPAGNATTPGGNMTTPKGSPTPTTPESTTSGRPTSPGSTTPGGPTSPKTPGSATPAGTTQPPTSTTSLGPTAPPPPVGGGGKDFCTGKEDGDYADPDNASGYISCSGGITYKRKCPSNLVWNNEKRVCDWPRNVRKDQHNRGRGHRLKDQVHAIKGYRGKVDAVVSDFCKGKVDGLDADPKNPSGFIMCSGNASYKMACPAGLVWNQVKKVCIWPRNVRKDQPSVVGVPKHEGQPRLIKASRGRVELVV